MRVWEVEENKAIPSNLVREQDFILRVRSMHRQGVPYLVLNITLGRIEASHGGRGPLEEAQERVQAFAKTTAGIYAEMSNGDVFVVWPSLAAPKDVEKLVMQAALPSVVTPEDIQAYVLSYRLPEDYPALRERTNHYVEMSRNTGQAPDENAPARLLLTEAARGPLTAWGVDQINKVIQDIDLQRYLKIQPVYERLALGTWRPIFEEWFVSFEELKRAHFPKMELVASDHLFFEVCQALDRRLLNELSSNTALAAKSPISINLSLDTTMGSAFAAFARELPRSAHNNVIVELNCGDLFRDFSQTLNTIETLRHEGFRVAIDGVTPDMLRFINFGLFEADYIKLNVSQERFAQLGDLQTREALMPLPRGKLIFYRCDNESAHTLGLSIGITMFQGWYVDEKLKSLPSG